MSVIADLYKSEINVSLESFYDLGFTVKLGDEKNEFKAIAHELRPEDLDQWLIEQAIKHYPESEFARKYR